MVVSRGGGGMIADTSVNSPCDGITTAARADSPRLARVGLRPTTRQPTSGNFDVCGCTTRANLDAEDRPNEPRLRRANLTHKWA